MNITKKIRATSLLRALTELPRDELELGGAVDKGVSNALEVRAVWRMRTVKVVNSCKDELRESHIRRWRVCGSITAQDPMTGRKISRQLHDRVLIKKVSHDNSIHTRHIFVGPSFYPAATRSLLSIRHQKTDELAFPCSFAPNSTGTPRSIRLS